MTRRGMGAVAVAALIGGFAVARAQTQGPAASQDIMPALLSEVRGLRAAMEQMATAGARVQLVLGRLQLQEQRLNNVIKRLDETRTRLADSQRGLAEMQEQLASLETVREGIGAVSVSIAHGGTLPSAEHVEVQKQEMQKHFARQTVHMNAEIQRLTAEEATLAAEVAGEQARWLEFNQKLEELERGLIKK
jgi:chromosome segregation ATPase